MFGTTRQLSYLYDFEGNRTRITHPDGQYFSYNRDGLNRVCTLGESTAAPACSTTDPNAFLVVHYSAEGRRADITRPGGSITSYATDNALRLDTFVQNFSGTTYDLTNGFDYNPASQITQLTQSNTQYNYTEAQNRVGAYGVNGLNRYTSIDGVAVTYDTNGNLTADGAGMTYSYDMENHLVATGGVASNLYYDVLGRLARVSVAGTTTDFLYDGDALVGEYVGSTLTRRYVHGGGVDEPLVQYQSATVGASFRRYLHADHQGSIIARTTNTGAVSKIQAYDPYGIPRGTNDERFGYTGQTWIKELGLNYYKARFYVPKIGRFLQTDPIFYADDMNIYAYVANDPLNFVDDTGEGKVKFLLKILRGDTVHFREGTRSQAVRHATNEGNVKVVGPGASGKARSVAEEAYGHRNVKRDNDVDGFGDGHYQPAKRRGKRGHVDYSLKSALVVGAIGDSAEKLTAGHYLGDDSALAEIVDFFNPISDIKEIAELLEEAEKENAENGQTQHQPEWSLGRSVEWCHLRGC